MEHPIEIINLVKSNIAEIESNIADLKERQSTLIHLDLRDEEKTTLIDFHQDQIKKHQANIYRIIKEWNII